MNSLLLNGITFKEMEKTFFGIGCEIARMLMKETLEIVDKELAESRDKARLRHKGKRRTTIKTLMGEVPVNRAMYKYFNDDGSTEYIYLLDEALGLDTVGLISPNLVEEMLEHVCEMSFREVSRVVSGFTGQRISHQGVWNVVQAVGEKQAEVEERRVKAFKNNELTGSREVPVLFEEADGLWLSMQGKSREKTQKGKKEIKVGIIYEGWRKRYPLSKEYETVGKTVICGFMKAEEFKELRDATIAEKYNTDEIIYRVLNGDGASWIRSGHDMETDIFQLDRYHLSRNMVRSVNDKRARRHIKGWLKLGEIDKALKKINELKHEYGPKEDEVKKLAALEEYINSSKDGVVLYKDRVGVELPAAPEGIEYRNLGTMEKNVDIFAKRMKGAKSWSEKGASNISKIIALKMGEGFKDKIAALVSGKLSERLTERFEKIVEKTRGSVKKAVKKSIYPMRRGGIPFSGSKVTNGRRAIRSLINFKPLSEMTYI